MAEAVEVEGSTTKIFSAFQGAATALPPTEQISRNFQSLPAQMPGGRSMAEAVEVEGSTTKICSASRGAATALPPTEQIATNFRSLPARIPGGRSVAFASLAELWPMGPLRDCDQLA